MIHQQPQKIRKQMNSLTLNPNLKQPKSPSPPKNEHRLNRGLPYAIRIQTLINAAGIMPGVVQGVGDIT